MSGIRSITRRPSIAGVSYATAGSAPFYVDSDDNTPKVIPAGSGTTELALALAVTASGARFAAGTGTLVTGAVIVATGLNTVLGFSTTLAGSGARATGATEVAQLTVTSITTGAVSVQGMYSTAAATWVSSVSGTSAFYWTAVGM